jgi:uncharacterized protein (TIGR02453 family)
MPENSMATTRLFDSRTLKFLSELAKNNDRTWFDTNRDRYETHVLAPSLAFIEEMAPRIARISDHFLAVPKRTGGSLMRIHRDMRFSRIKLPYKINIGIQFRHERARDVHAPGFYVHIEPRASFVGVGIWRPDAKALTAIRKEIVDEPVLWRKASRAKRFTDVFALGGESLRRPPKGFPADSPDIADLKRKGFIASTRLRNGEVTARDLPGYVADRFRRAAPLMAFLCGALDLDY